MNFGRIGAAGVLCVCTAMGSAAETTGVVEALTTTGAVEATTASVLQAADLLMGDWASDSGGGPVAQVIALGGGKYRVNVLPEFDRKLPPLAVLEGAIEGDKVVLEGQGGQGEMSSNKMEVRIAGRSGDPVELKRTSRLSPTLGEKPPAGSVVLFAGGDLSGWESVSGKPAAWKPVDGEAMQVVPKTESIKSKEKFGDARFHIEFRSPFMPDARGQKRGNSGVYVNGVYEIQVLDSYGLEGAENECGGLYKAAAPRVNMCAPPLQWQTYDIDYRAPRFDATGTKTENARISVKHNGVSIHENVTLPAATPGGVSKEELKEPGPLMLQEHGDPVQFRNIWVVRSGQTNP